MTTALISQLPVEAVVTNGPSAARVSQVAVESIVTAGPSAARVSQVVIEVVYTRTATPAIPLTLMTIG